MVWKFDYQRARLSEVIGMLYILFWVVVTGMHMIIKNHWTKKVDFIVYKVYLNKNTNKVKKIKASSLIP